jgi:AbrB family looped-hinge helix DNA binding protein
MMSESEIIKVTSKGQITIPSKFRKELSLDRDSYLYVARSGKILVLKKVDDLSLDEITSLYETIAKSEGITREMLLEEVEKAREELMEQGYVKA